MKVTVLREEETNDQTWSPVTRSSRSRNSDQCKPAMNLQQEVVRAREAQRNGYLMGSFAEDVVCLGCDARGEGIEATFD